METKGIGFITRLLLGVFLGALLCILGIVAVVTADDGAQLPIRSLRITIDVNRREELFAQLRRFAEKHGFEILIREVKVHPDGTFIAMYRNGLKILANDVPESPTIISLGFYYRYPAFSVSQANVDELFKDLKAFISEIPNVTVTDEK
jgi:hypothetical protein